MKRPWWNPQMGVISLCVTVWILHALLKLALSEYDIVSAIFAAGEHVPPWMLWCAGVFVVLRLFLLLVAPGLLAWRATVWLIEKINPVKDEAMEEQQAAGVTPS